MPLYLDSFKNNSSEDFNSRVDVEGLESFKKSLEKYFFSEVTITNCSVTSKAVNLAIEVNCNLSLVEMLFHFNKKSWGSFKPGKSSFLKILQLLNKENQIAVDVEEFSLFLKDTTIIISKIYTHSIPEQLNTIFSEVGKQYVHFSKGLTETPYEIYVPVFEETSTENDTLLMNIESSNHTKKDYLNYWGLYFYSEDDAVIYDINKSSIEQGDLFMLNH